MRTIEVVESQAIEVDLADEDAFALRALGQRLAKIATREAQRGRDADGGETIAPVALRPLRGKRWSLRINDAIGVVATPGVCIVSRSKIPEAHLLHLMEVGGYLPRGASTPTAVQVGDDLWRLTCTWFLDEAEALLRRGLARDYRSASGPLPVVRGRVDAVPTVTNLLKGRVAVSCTFDEFDEDASLNRVVRAAARAVARSPLLGDSERRRAFAVVQAMRGVGPCRPADLRAVVTRATVDYRAPFGLALLVLNAHGPEVRTGDHQARSFLIRTPDAVEAGIRCLLGRGPARSWVQVEKRSKRLSPSSLTITPDLYFSPSGVVGDVKYRLADGKWDRGHLYQAAAFATAFRASAAIVVAFSDQGYAAPPSLQVGDVILGAAYWDARQQSDPRVSADRLVASVDRWMATHASSMDSLGLPKLAA